MSSDVVVNMVITEGGDIVMIYSIYAYLIS